MNREKEIGRDIEERRTRTRRGKNERVVICHGKRPFSQYYFPQSVINCSHISPFSTARLFLFFPFRPVAAPFLFLIVNSTRSFRRLTTAVTRSYLAEISVVGTLWFSTNTKTEGCTSTVKRGIKRKIKRRIALSCIRESVAHTRMFELELTFFYAVRRLRFLLFVFSLLALRSTFGRWPIEGGANETNSSRCFL